MLGPIATARAIGGREEQLRVRRIAPSRFGDTFSPSFSDAPPRRSVRLVLVLVQIALRAGILCG